MSRPGRRFWSQENRDSAAWQDALQIDHLVPVSEAWDSGAHLWSQPRRVSFYNDLGVGYALNAMPGALNQAKTDKGPEAWMPPGEPLPVRRGVDRDEAPGGA